MRSHDHKGFSKTTGDSIIFQNDSRMIPDCFAKFRNNDSLLSNAVNHDQVPFQATLCGAGSTAIECACGAWETPADSSAPLRS